MEFKDTYISETAKLTQPTSKKIVLSDDAYAVGEQLADLNILFAKMAENK